MSKTFLLSLLVAFAAVGVAGAQTPPPRLTPTSTPPMPAAPVQQVAFKVMPQPAPAAPRFLTKVFEVADLVGLPTDSPLAKPTDDPAMQAAAAAYMKVRAEQLKKILRNTVDAASWEENGGAGKMDYYPAGQSLVVNAPAEVVVRVGECLESLRKLQVPQVFVEMLVFEVASDHPAMKKLFGKKREAALTKEELTKLVRELKAEGALDVLSRPQLMLTDKQTGFFQVGQQFPRLTAATPADKGAPGLQQVGYVNTGLVVRLTPECLGDGKPTRMRLEVSITEPSRTQIDLGNGIKATPIDTQSIDTTVEVADGGTMAVNVGPKMVEQRVEHKVPVLGDLPFVGRLFRNVGIGHEWRDTVVVFTTTRVKSEKELHQLISRESLEMQRYATKPIPAVLPPCEVQRVNGSPLPPNALPVPMMVPAPVAVTPPAQMPVPPRAVAPVAVPPMTVAPIAPPPATPYVDGRFLPPPRPMVPPPAATEGLILTSRGTTHAVPGSGFHFNTTVPEVVEERIGVDFHLIPASGSVPVTGRIAGAGHGGIPAGDETTALLRAYQAACAAGKKDEASRLALQLLAKDPTCFGRDR